MPLIEELPVTTATRASHGWTYLPDNTAPATTGPLGSRKRGRDGNLAAAQSAHKLSAKQEKAIQQRLHDLGKENHRDVNIPVPKRDGARGKDRKPTQNVRRILAYSRTFQHYLADEEAGVNVYGSAGIVPPSNAGAQAAQTQSQKKTDHRKRGTTTDARVRQTGTPRRPGLLKQSASSTKSTPATIKTEPPVSTNDVAMIDAPPAPAPQPSQPPKSPQPTQQMSSPSALRSPQTTASTYDPASDRDPLLRTHDIPKMPSDRVMQALLAEPPLSYTAARAKPLDNPTSTGAVTWSAMRVGSSAGLAKPQRWFCAACGYWGKVRCKYGCGERVCGLLECWRTHEGACALNRY